MHLKVASAKWRQCCFGLELFIYTPISDTYLLPARHTLILFRRCHGPVVCLGLVNAILAEVWLNAFSRERRAS